MITHFRLPRDVRIYFKFCFDLVYMCFPEPHFKILIWFKVEFTCVTLKNLRTLVRHFSRA